MNGRPVKEIDFDELDRAVNSLASQVKSHKSNPKPSTAATNTVPTSGEALKPVPQKTPQTTANSVAVHVTSGRHTRLTTRPSAARRKGFIDIVAPKAAVKPPVSRTGGTIQPISKPEELKPQSSSAATTALPAEPKPASPEVRSTIPEPTQQKATPVPAKSAETWPDPLDFHTDELTPAAKPDVKPSQPSTAEPMAAMMHHEPDASPFLPDAKVEKRPLGAFAASPDQPQTPVPTGAPEDLATNANSLPEELRPEVLAVESDQTPVEDQPEPALTTESLQPDKAPKAPAPPSAQQQVQDSGMMSIPQQYKTNTQAADESHRPVFDTKEYHPPLLEATAHGAHHSSPWVKLFMALLVLGVLAAGGYLAFIYFVQNY